MEFSQVINHPKVVSKALYDLIIASLNFEVKVEKPVGREEGAVMMKMPERVKEPTQLVSVF